MKYLLPFFLTFYAIAWGFSEPIRKVESITYRAQGTEMTGTIKLNDGSLWIWAPDMYSIHFLRPWKEGDEVIVTTANHPGFLLYNVSKPRYQPIVSLTFQSYALFPYITNLSKNGTVIELSDGSSWKIIYDFNLRTVSHWSRGDRLITAKGIKQNYELINLDIPFENRLSIERNIQVEKLSP